jgi:hypothetical protein
MGGRPLGEMEALGMARWPVVLDLHHHRTSYYNTLAPTSTQRGGPPGSPRRRRRRLPLARRARNA